MITCVPQSEKFEDKLHPTGQQIIYITSRIKAPLQYSSVKTANDKHVAWVYLITVELL